MELGQVLFLVHTILVADSGNSVNLFQVPDHVKQIRREMLEDEKTTAADRIAIINEETDKDLYEGDIDLTTHDKSFVDLRDTGDVDGPLSTATKRNAQRARQSLWMTKEVPYEIDPILVSEGFKNAIDAAINEFRTKTCIKWVLKKPEDKLWVKFVHKSGCWSHVGRKYWLTNQFQELSLGRGCNHQGTIMHEMMHAVGFWHEQSRPDRNQYVEVMWENIQEGKEHNFNKYSHGTIDRLNVQYNYGSLMHYGKNGFSSNGLPTLLAIGDKNKPLGQRNGFSDMDVIELNALYDCSKPSGGYSNWSPFGPCDSRCYHMRQRFCTEADKSKCPGADYYGIQTETAKCPDSKCNAPVNGHWGRWSSWSSCTATCEKGTKTRTRKCNDPAPAKGGSNCVGDDTGSTECVMRRCGLGPDDCEFDSDKFCFWTQDKSDTSVWDWIRHSGSTSSSSTGPSGDHSTGKGNYIYFEASSPVQTGQYSRLLSKEFPATSGRCMSFWYHMYGSGVGALYVRQQDLGSGSLFKVWEKAGNQQNKWHKGSLTIKSSGGYKIIFEAVRGSDFRGDIALDDIYFKEAPCGKAAPAPTPTPTSSPVTCSFDTDNCGWETNKWLRHAGATPTANTGPTADHTTGKTPYTYKGCYQDSRDRSLPKYIGEGYGNAEKCYQAIKAKGYKAFGMQYGGECWSGPNAQQTYDSQGTSKKCAKHLGGSWANDVFLVTDGVGFYMYLPAVGFAQGSKSRMDAGKNFPLTSSEGSCLSVWYNMNGENIGTLNIYVKSSSQELKVWSKSGNQSQKWRNARITLNVQTEFRIIFEGVRGNGNAGDIAIDDFSLTNKPC